MLHKELTFNDLPTVVNQLCEKIASLESMMEKHFATPVQKKENTHVPMSREEVCAYLGGITKSSFYHKVKFGKLPVVKQGLISGWRLEEKVILSRVLKRNTMLCVHPFAVDLNL